MRTQILTAGLATLTLTQIAPAQVDGAGSSEALGDAIETRLGEVQHTGTVAIHIEEVGSGDVVFSQSADEPMIPASNNKLQTTATALALLGPDHTRTTRILTNGEVDGTGCLRGDLIVVGDGDPLIGPRSTEGEGVAAVFVEWAERLEREHGIRAIEGRVIGDDDLFTDQLLHDSWSERELGEWYSAESTALSFNDNCVDIHWVAGQREGRTPNYTLDPDTGYVDIVNLVETLGPNADTDRYYDREREGVTVRVTGGIPRGTERTDWTAVHNPTLYTVTTLRDTLIAEGMSVMGEAVDIDDVDRERVYADTHELFAIESPPLRDMVFPINNTSQNFIADMVLRLIGVETRGEGSFHAGAAAVAEFMAEHTAMPAGWAMVDGSGLSDLNRTSVHCLVSLFRAMDGMAPEVAAAFRDSLPRGQADRGSLRRRFAQSDRHLAVAPQITGKTGYIGGVWALSGILVNQAGEEMYYSIILNGYESDVASPIRLIDDLAVEIAASTFGESGAE